MKVNIGGAKGKTKRKMGEWECQLYSKEKECKRAKGLHRFSYLRFFRVIKKSCLLNNSSHMFKAMQKYKTNEERVLPATHSLQPPILIVS